MIASIAAFEAAWKNENTATLKVLRALTDASLAQPVAPGGRTLGRIAWHIVQTLGEMTRQAGLDVKATDEHTPQPTSAAAFADAYEVGAKAVAEAVSAAWKDEQLADLVDMYGDKWPRSGVLYALIVHEVHHRGQMTVLMRQAGIAVPGVYGPSKEEWVAYGMPAQE